MITIRPSRISDLTALRNLSIAAFTHAYAAHNTEADMSNYLAKNFSEAAMLAEQNDPSLHFLLAFQNDDLVGYAKLDLESKPQGGAVCPVEIARLYTKPELIGSGIGKQMIAAVEEYARKNGFDAIWLGVWQRNFRAVNFYQREGFRISGLTQFLLGDDLQDDFVMMKKVD